MRAADRGQDKVLPGQGAGSHPVHWRVTGGARGRENFRGGCGAAGTGGGTNQRLEQSCDCLRAGLGHRHRQSGIPGAGVVHQP